VDLPHLFDHPTPIFLKLPVVYFDSSATEAGNPKVVGLSMLKIEVDI
jgi:hypothetical protein